MSFQGHRHTDEAKRKMSEIHKGKPTWSKGLTKETDERIKKISEANKGQHRTEEARYRMSNACRGRHFSLETRRKIGEANKGRHYTKMTRRKMSEANKGQHLSLEAKRKIGEKNKKHWQNPNFVRKMILAYQIKPNHAERKFDAILQEVCPGEFALNVHANIMVLGGKIPDFVNVNGKKQLIELYGDYWHDPKRFPDRQSPQERIDYFRQFGWEVLVVWEHELKDEVILKRKLQTFVNQFRPFLGENQ